MTRFLSLAVFALSLGGCSSADSGAACQAYMDAYSACAAEAYNLDDGTYDLPASTCTPYVDLTGARAADAVDLLTCYAAAYDEGDCSSPDTLNAVGTRDVLDCASDR